MTLAIPLTAHIDADQQPDGDVRGVIHLGAPGVVGVQVWADTYPPGTPAEGVLHDMLHNLADVLNDARLGR